MSSCSEYEDPPSHPCYSANIRSITRQCNFPQCHDNIAAVVLIFRASWVFTYNFPALFTRDFLIEPCFIQRQNVKTQHSLNFTQNNNIICIQQLLWLVCMQGRK